MSFPSVPTWVWEPRFVDSAAVLTAAMLVLLWLLWTLAKVIDLFLAGRRKPPKTGDEVIRPTASFRKFLLSAGGVAVSLLGMFVAYATFRTTNMMSALQYVSANSAQISEMERTIPQVDCLYRWGDQSRESAREGCGRDIFVTSDGQRLSASFDDIQLYVEESLLFFIDSEIYKEKYGADFYQGLEYWTQDFSDDWTGAISFYLISREIDDVERNHPSLHTVDARSVACIERFTGIQIEDPCSKYRQFRAELGDAGTGFNTAVRCEVPPRPQQRESLLDHEPPNFCDSTWWGTHFAGRGQRLRNLTRHS